jgi:hypothetical protein
MPFQEAAKKKGDSSLLLKNNHCQTLVFLKDRQIHPIALNIGRAPKRIQFAIEIPERNLIEAVKRKTPVSVVSKIILAEEKWRCNRFYKFCLSFFQLCRLLLAQPSLRMVEMKHARPSPR